MAAPATRGHAGRVDHVARAVVVRAVQHHRGLGHELVEQGIVCALLAAINADAGVDGMHGRAYGVHLGLAHAIGGVGNLALQVGHVHGIVVHQGDAADAGRAQVQRGRRAQAACADDEHMRCQDALLAFDADLVQQDVARVAQQLIVVHSRLQT
jgi:hypothetical protein